MSNQVCYDCNYYKHQQGEESGYCYGNPPIPTLINTANGPQPVSIEAIVSKKRQACALFAERRVVLLGGH